MQQVSGQKLQRQWRETTTSKKQPKSHLEHLLGEPGAAGLSDPLSGVDSSVDPDGGTVGSTSAELRNRKGSRALFHAKK